MLQPHRQYTFPLVPKKINTLTLDFLRYRRVLSRFHNDIKHPDGLVVDELPHKIPIIGFSATFSRHDGIALGAVFESIVYHRDFLEMIKEQWSVPASPI